MHCSVSVISPGGWPVFLHFRLFEARDGILSFGCLHLYSSYWNFISGHPVCNGFLNEESRPEKNHSRRIVF